MNLTHSLRAGVAAVLGLAGVAASATTLTFDELPSQPVDGLSFNGVTFGFEVGGSPSADAVYNGAGPGILTFVQDPVLEGDASGLLTLIFATPTPDLGFGLALNSFASLTPGAVVNFYDDGGLLLDSASLDLDPLIDATEGGFSWTGATAAKRAVIDFDDAAASRFALDNLTFTTRGEVVIPESSTLLGGGLVAGLAALGFLRRRRA